MKVFLSWSGEKSRAVAEALREWLPKVLQEVEPFMSSEDISAGARWQYLISDALEGSSVGILCVTRENQSAPWLNFEAGAIAKQVESVRVIPLAIDLSVADVKPPLGHFQAKEMSASGIFAVLESINGLFDKPRSDLAELWAVWWPRLEPKLEAASSEIISEPVRSDRELLEELLTTVRSLRPPQQLSFDMDDTEYALSDLQDLLPAGIRARLTMKPTRVCVVASDQPISQAVRDRMAKLVQAQGYGIRFEGRGDQESVTST